MKKLVEEMTQRIFVVVWPLLAALRAKLQRLWRIAIRTESRWNNFPFGFHVRVEMIDEGNRILFSAIAPNSQIPQGFNRRFMPMSAGRLQGGSTSEKRESRLAGADEPGTIADRGRP
jgi:hypothetical protein